MQDPEHTRDNGKGLQVTPGSVERNEDETDPDKTTDPKVLVGILLRTARRKVMETGGSIELIEKEEESRTVFHFGNTEITLTIASNQGETKQRIEVAILEPVMGPYQTSYHERGLDNKRRTFWPAAWKKAIPTMAIYDPSGPELKIIFTKDPKTEIPAGWLVATKTNGLLNFKRTGENSGQLRISLGKLFGKNKRIKWPESVDINGHGDFAIMVASGASDSLPLSLS